jgi:hypothetical protein
MLCCCVEPCNTHSRGCAALKYLGGLHATTKWMGSVIVPCRVRVKCALYSECLLLNPTCRSAQLRAVAFFVPTPDVKCSSPRLRASPRPSCGANAQGLVLPHRARLLILCLQVHLGDRACAADWRRAPMISASSASAC